MHSKEWLLLYLDQHRDRYVSGEELREHLGVSRATLWQMLRSLLRNDYPRRIPCHAK